MSFVHVGGCSIAIRWVGDARPGRPTLVFLHEGLGSIRQWRDWPASVARATGGSAFVYDRPGYGASDAPAAPRDHRYLHEEATVVLPALLARLGIEDPVLVGHSDGATIALIHAGSGFRVRALVVEAPHVFVEDCSVIGARAAREAFERGGLRERLAKYHVDPERMFRSWNDPWSSDDFRTWNVTGLLAGIRVPVLAIQGGADEYGTMAQVEAIARGVNGPCELLRLEDAGHAPHRERRDEVLVAVTRFLRGLDPPYAARA